LKYHSESVQRLIDYGSGYGATACGVLHLMGPLPVKPDGRFPVVNSNLKLKTITVAICLFRWNSITDEIGRNACSPPECFYQNIPLLFKLLGVPDMLPVASSATAE
jgi:hypothetical protein